MVPYLKLGYNSHQGLCAKPDEVFPKGTETLQPPEHHPNTKVSAEERSQNLFFEIDWDLKPEINIHTLHRTEHLIAIYFKGRVVIPLPRECGLVCVWS